MEEEGRKGKTEAIMNRKDKYKGKSGKYKKKEIKTRKKINKQAKEEEKQMRNRRGGYKSYQHIHKHEGKKKIILHNKFSVRGKRSQTRSYIQNRKTSPSFLQQRRWSHRGTQ